MNILETMERSLEVEHRAQKGAPVTKTVKLTDPPMATQSLILAPTEHLLYAVQSPQAPTVGFRHRGADRAMARETVTERQR